MTACSGSEVNIFFSTSELELTPCQWVKTSAYKVSVRLELFGHLACDVVRFHLCHAVAVSVPCFSISWSEKTVFARRIITPPDSLESTRKRTREDSQVVDEVTVALR